MNRLKDALSMERSRLFVGRRDEMQHVQKWLTQEDAPTQVLFVSGMGGMGKSALLLQFMNAANHEDTMCVWLDGRNCAGTPHEFLGTLHAYIYQPSDASLPSMKAMQEIIEAIRARRTILCIDNLENLQQMTGWLREVFLPELPDTGLLIVFAARQDLSSEWRTDLAWRERTMHIPLGPLSRWDAHKYYTNLGVDDGPGLETLIRTTHGHPLTMALAVESGKTINNTQNWPVWRQVSAQLLREVVTPDMQDILDVLSILPYASQELLSRLIGRSLDLEQIRQLTLLSFVRPAMDGFALHDVARAHLLEDFSHREPERYQNVRQRIVEVACDVIRSSNPETQRHMAANLLSICRDVLPLGSNIRFSANPLETSFDVLRTGDLPHLHRIMEYDPQKAIPLKSEAHAHQLLDTLAERFPERIRVFRSAEGVPLVFHAGVLLFRDTYALLQSYIPLVIESVFPAEAKRIKHLRHEEADTYYHLLGGADYENPNYSPRELYGFMFTDGFSHVFGYGTRFVLTTQYDSIKEICVSLGCQAKQLRSLPTTHPARGDIAFELDFRTSNLGDWVSSFLKTPMAQPRNKSPWNITANDLKAALYAFGNPISLEQTVVARSLNCSGEELQARLRHLLTSDPPLHPLTRSEQSVLNTLCAEPSGNSVHIAAKLYMSRPTYYRQLQSALNKSIDLLSAWRD